MGSVLSKILNAGGVGGAINEATNMIVSLASGKIPEKVILVAGMILAVLIGTIGYKYIKLFSTAIFGAVGYAIGFTAFRMVQAHFGWDVPGFVAYLAGIAVLVLLGFLAYKKFAYAMFLIAGAVGFLVGYFIYPSYFLGAALAIIVAMVAMNFVRYGFVGIMSVSAGFILMGMISAMAPNVRLLSLSEGFVGKLLALIISFVFVAIQLRVSHSEAKKQNGPRRVKIRRVFDTW